jgi:hypothetical protein
MLARRRDVDEVDDDEDEEDGEEGANEVMKELVARGEVTRRGVPLGRRGVQAAASPGLGAAQVIDEEATDEDEDKVANDVDEVNAEVDSNAISTGLVCWNAK